MALTAGTRLGPYQIGAPLGAGGMGEVYRATDTGLGRSVAIKILPEAFAADPDRMARFEREAKTLASLNHPQIAAVYGFEKSNGVHALVMELVEGDDLSTVIARGAIPLADALPIARQIADALEAAHEQGIVHRDLKPANIKVRADGTVKVLDFGLAKAMAPDGGSGADAMNSPTLTAAAFAQGYGAPGTQLGMIIGTAAYMAPEQAKGKSVDRRADIWAFGVVLYEMLTGARAFKGDDISETLASVLKDTPAIEALPAGTPVRLRELILRCLQKDPRVRQRDIGDAKLELDAIAAGRGDAALVASVAASRPRPPLALVAAAGLVTAALGVVIGWGLPRNSAAATSATARFIVAGPTDGGLAYAPLLTPNGRTLVFAVDRLYKRDLGAFAATPMPGTDGATSPMISPDGRWIAFFANGKIKKVSLAGGDPTTIAEAGASIPGAAWGPGDTLLFGKGWASGLFSVPADGGPITQLTEPDLKLGERGHWRPRMLPGGQQVLFTIWMAGSGSNDARVGLLDLKTKQHRALFPGTDAVYLRSGHLLYFHAGAWHVVPFDAVAGNVTGDPMTVLDDALGVPPDGGNSWHTIWASDNGTLAYMPGPWYETRELVWADRAGTIESLGLPPRALVDAALSPDGHRVAVSRLEAGTFELWMDDVARKTEDRLDIKGSNFGPVWTSPGDAIAFVSERKGEYDTYTARADGTDVKPLLTKDVDEAPMAWTRDGRWLIEKEWHPDGTTPLIVFDTSGVSAPRVLTANMGPNARVKLSPDEHWILSSSASSGRSEVFVQAFPAGAPIVRVSSNGGNSPLWSPTGAEIFFRHDKDLVSVSFRQEGGRSVIGTETPLFRLESSDVYGITSDGRRFLLGRVAGPEPPPGIRVVLNWFEELKARVPAGK